MLSRFLLFALLASGLTASLAATSARAQPEKPSPPAAEARPGDGRAPAESPTDGKKVKTESEKVEDSKPKPKATGDTEDKAVPPGAGGGKPARGP